MIVRFRHKGLKRLFDSDTTHGVRSDHAKRLRRILAALDAARTPSDLALPSFRLHPLKGDLEGTWSISVSGNWRVTFRFEGDDVTDVNDMDYH